MPLIGQLIMGLVTRVLANQLTKQNINDEVQELDKQITYEIYKRDRVIQILEKKLQELEGQVDELAFKKIDEIEKKVQEKTPFFVDPFVKQAGEHVKVELDKLTDDFAKAIVDLVEKAKDKVEEVTGLDLTPDSEPVTEKDLEFHDDVDKSNSDDVVGMAIDNPPGLSERAKEILDNLRDKHKNDEEGD